MKKHVKNILVIMIFILGLFGSMQNGYCQSSSLHDSLRHILRHFQENARDENLKQAAKDVQLLYSSNIIKDSLVFKLLFLDSLLLTDQLLNDQQVNQQMKFSYIRLLVQLFQNIPPIQEHPAYVNSLSNLGEFYRNGRQFEKALPLFQQSIAISKKTHSEQHPAYANIMNNMASLYIETGQYEKALPFSEQALAIYKNVYGEKHLDYAMTLAWIAQIYYYMAQYEKALPLSEQAIAIQRIIVGDQHPDYATSLNNLAVLYRDMGQNEKAISMYNQALKIYAKAPGEERGNAITLGNIALSYLDMGQHDKALPLFTQALTIRKKIFGEEHPAYAMTLNNIASLYRRMGQYDKALPLYTQTLAIRKKIFGEEHPEYATSLNNLAVLYGNMGQNDKALPLAQLGLKIRKKRFGEEHPDYASSLIGLAKLNVSLGKPKESAPLLIQASNIILRHLYQTYATLSEQEKMTFLKSKASQFEYLSSLLTIKDLEQPALIKQVYTNELVLKGMVLQDQQHVLSSIRKGGDTTALQLYEQWRFNKAFLGKQLLLPIDKRLSYLDSLQEVTNQLEQQLSQYSATFRNLKSSQAITVKDIAHKLTKDQAAVEFISFRLSNKKWTDSTLYAALVLLPGDSNARFVPLFEERQLQRLLLSSSKRVNVKTTIDKLYPGTIGGRASPAYSDSLYQLVWKPLEKYLTGIHTVYYAPAGLLHRIAFAALQVDASHLLVDNYQLKQVLSTGSVAQPLAPIQTPSTASLWGNIDYSLTKESTAKGSAIRGPSRVDTSAASFNLYAWDTRGLRGGAGWDVLPYSKGEIDSLEKILTTSGIAVTTSSGALATEEAFKGLDGNSSQVMHLATHGFFLPLAKRNKDEFDRGGSAFTLQQNPMFRSGLVMAGGNHAWQGKPAIAGKEDGILTAYEIAQLDLSNTELMVLSACGTALGDMEGNEGVIGLQRALKLAGVKQMIISLWDVPDKAAMMLMTMFYRNWLSGQSTRDALRNAQLKMKQKYPPYFWAAFVVVE
jgi:CHAT domain-containing protein